MSNDEGRMTNENRPPGRLLGVDFGSKRIGLSICDPACSIASPLATVDAGGGDEAAAGAVLRAAESFAPVAIVLGLPLNMDGTEGPQAKATRRFGQVLAGIVRLPVYLWDERLSSVAAEDALRDAALPRKKQRARVDRVAAQMILQGFLDAGAWWREPEYVPS
ncbi:MAG: Holliday junction resolvase RuvX [Phycisphaerales bacterium]|nr:MAG: Holliday junction resolvase RuvX [Phycisphaerales bacterium]